MSIINIDCLIVIHWQYYPIMNDYCLHMNMSMTDTLNKTTIFPCLTNLKSPLSTKNWWSPKGHNLTLCLFLKANQRIKSYSSKLSNVNIQYWLSNSHSLTILSYYEWLLSTYEYEYHALEVIFCSLLKRRKE
jgi:hypothetical protein